MSDTLKVVIPMAGLGTRLRPHTWSRPKQLISLAGKSVLSHIFDMFATLTDFENVEFIFIVGYLGDKVEAYMKKHHPRYKVKYVVQAEMRGQSHAIYLTKEYLNGPMLMVFADTLIETDLASLGSDDADVVAWVKPVPDPRRFGVAELGEDGLVKRLIEKPKEMHNNLAVVGFYYFKQSADLVSAIEEQMRRELKLKGEFFLADAINIMLERGDKMRTQRVDVWMDAGTVEAVLETNHYLLEHGHDNSAEASQRPGITVIPPVFIHPSADVQASVIGPYASIGARCVVTNSVIRESILEDRAKITGLILTESLIGQNALVNGSSISLNVGDNSEINI
ncbi:MAG: 2-C-methyl-D-erythritol 4-phosphate cytidylyltransferase [Chloroflexi bacterium]|nr:2-C-methyl-D-erythritol 4-phosphate cytidylyltransferase [Chloroflexota bacterium]MBU1660164.1 2-C-methyl-D-erythritol 4-phosphate cytidylyltransferase [Chloroflexota bacterium]